MVIYFSVKSVISFPSLTEQGVNLSGVILKDLFLSELIYIMFVKHIFGNHYKLLLEIIR